MADNRYDAENRASGLIDAFPPECFELSHEEKRMSVTLYRMLTRGQPVPVGRVASALATSEQTVETLLEEWPATEYDPNRHIIAFGGLSLSETPHRFEVESAKLFTWCAWDSLFIPGIVNTTAQVTSTCPVTGTSIKVAVTPERVERASPAETAMSFMVLGSEGDENIVDNFCCHIHFFRSADAAAEWTRTREGTFVLSLEEAFLVGQQWNIRQYG